MNRTAIDTFYDPPQLRYNYEQQVQIEVIYPEENIRETGYLQDK